MAPIYRPWVLVVAKISNESRRQYLEHIAPYKDSIDKLINKETRIEASFAEADRQDPYKLLELSTDNLTVISLYIAMNHISLSLLGIKNETALNNARKTCYKAVIHMEQVFTNLIDVPFSEYKDSLDSVPSFSEFERYKLVRKLGFSIAIVRDGFGENTRWKWSLVELDGRLATVAKNILNLRMIVEDLDPRADKYRERNEYFNLVWRLLQESADSYRIKYEVSTGRRDDFRIAIQYLSAMRRLAYTLGRQHEAMDLKQKIDTWKDKMEADEKNQERKQRLQHLEDKPSAKTYS